MNLNVLSPAQVEHFMERGYVRLEEAFPRKNALAAQDYIWQQVEKQGVLRDDRSTWTIPRVHLREQFKPALPSDWPMPSRICWGEIAGPNARTSQLMAGDGGRSTFQWGAVSPGMYQQKDGTGMDRTSAIISIAASRGCSCSVSFPTSLLMVGRAWWPKAHTTWSPAIYSNSLTAWNTKRR